MWQVNSSVSQAPLAALQNSPMKTALLMKCETPGGSTITKRGCYQEQNESWPKEAAKVSLRVAARWPGTIKGMMRMAL